MFVAVLHCIIRRLVQYLPHSIIHPVQEWSGFLRHFWFCFVVRIHLIVINNKSVRVLCEQTRWLFRNKSPCSHFHQFIRFPLLRRPLLVSIPFWVVWWTSAHYRSPRSWLLLIPRAQRYVTFRFGVHRAFRCSRGKHVRIPYPASRDQIHHRLWFCCDSFFTCILLRSFRHHFKTIGRTAMANVEQTQKMIPFITCEISLCQYVCELVYGVKVFDLDLEVQNWFYRTTNQEQLCGFWKWSPLHYLQTHTTKLPWRVNEFSFVFEVLWSAARMFVYKSRRSWLLWYVFPRRTAQRVSPFYHGSELCFQGLKKSDPINQVRVYHPTSILHLKKWFLILLNCAKLKFVSYTSSWLERTCGFRKHNVPPAVAFESSKYPA